MLREISSECPGLPSLLHVREFVFCAGLILVLQKASWVRAQPVHPAMRGDNQIKIGVRMLPIQEQQEIRKMEDRRIRISITSDPCYVSYFSYIPYYVMLNRVEHWKLRGGPTICLRHTGFKTSNATSDTVLSLTTSCLTNCRADTSEKNVGCHIQ